MLIVLFQTFLVDPMVRWVLSLAYDSGVRDNVNDVVDQELKDRFIENNTRRINESNPLRENVCWASLRNRNLRPQNTHTRNTYRVGFFLCEGVFFLISFFLFSKKNDVLLSYTVRTPSRPYACMRDSLLYKLIDLIENNLN